MAIEMGDRKAEGSPELRLSSPKKSIFPYFIVFFGCGFFLIWSYRWVFPSWKYAGNNVGNVSLHQSRLSGGMDFDWNGITPSTSLTYHPCFNSIQCARLIVPLDWNNTEDERRVILAITRLPARVSVTDVRYGGAILVNPGGPGSSGVGFSIRAGKMLQLKADAEIEPEVLSSSTTKMAKHKYFDIMSFDPRGINNTQPSFCCFSSNPGVSFAHTDGNVLNSSDRAFGENWAQYRAFAESCSQSIRENRSNTHLSSYMNTAVVAEDIIAIVEQHGKWREEEVKRLLGDSNNDNTAVIQPTSWKRDQEDVLWWGFSYGTVIGATLAAMYPDRVHRMILDGVNEANSWYGGYQQLIVMEDADAVMNTFFQYCFEAGPELCSFAADHENAMAIEEHLRNLLEEIKEQPVPVLASSTRGADIITYSDIIRMIWSALFSPLKSFPVMANALSDLTKGNGSGLADMKVDSRATEDPNSCRIDISAAVMCTDHPDQTGLTRRDFEDEYEVMKNLSQWTVHINVGSHMMCSGWRHRPKWKYPYPIQGNTKHPILFAGNTFDPVGPLSGAYKISKGFNGSVVLEQLAAGHCTSSFESACSSMYFRRYWQTGQLPAPGTKCEVLEKPFGLGREKMGEEDGKLIHGSFQW